jgi:hypothetical protein
MFARSSTLIAEPREPQEALVAKTGYWLLNCMTEPSP